MGRREDKPTYASETTDELLSRDDFREGVFKRDNYKCVICGEPAQDAHHIIERRLFKDGGYYLNNGASLCGKHHIEAEQTTLECDEIRNAIGINKVILPSHFYHDQEYDKWGNPILKNGTRTKGDLFGDESVQKILRQGGVLDLFVDHVKYPRTYHFEWSPGLTRDDRMLHDISQFEGKRVIIMEKMDGENTNMYVDKYHARSLDTGPHPSRNWAKNLWAQTSYNIPKGWRVCGENLYAKHSIHYTKENGNALKSYFYMFSIWDDNNMCLSWDETKEWAELLNLELVPVLYDGIWDKDVIDRISKYVEDNKGLVEGYVIRVADEYHYSEFRKMCGKYVRANHVQNNHGHWASAKIVPNELI